MKGLEEKPGRGRKRLYEADAVERFFAELTEKRLRRGIFRSVLDLIEAIDAYLEERNQNPKPFLWTKTADEILDKPAPVYAN
jgi:hypothetical protein